MRGLAGAGELVVFAVEYDHSGRDAQVDQSRYDSGCRPGSPFSHIRLHADSSILLSSRCKSLFIISYTESESNDKNGIKVAKKDYFVLPVGPHPSELKT